MNLNGKPVLKILSKFGSLEETFIKDNLLVITDELHKPFGKYRIKNGGSAGGHNGVKGTFIFFKLYNKA